MHALYHRQDLRDVRHDELEVEPQLVLVLLLRRVGPAAAVVEAVVVRDVRNVAAAIRGAVEVDRTALLLLPVKLSLEVPQLL